jgi:hypothetical protein
MANQTLTTFTARAIEKVKDPSNRIPTGERPNFTSEAIREYSRHKPRLEVDELTGDGTTTIFDTPARWIIDFSAIIRAEHPVDETPLQYIEGSRLDDFLEIQKPTVTTEKIVTKDITLPASGTSQIIRFWFTGLHTVTATAGDDTTPDHDFDAIANLIASKMALAIAAFYSDARESTIAADSVNHVSKAAEFRAQAKQFRTEYLKHIGIADEKQIPGEIRHAELDIEFSWRRDLLFHRRRLT